MGTGHSKVLASDPAKYATPIDDLSEAKKYDYVIVGGGTAGCVLASRLSEDRAVSVLLIEAGSSNEDYLLSFVPLGFPKIFKTSGDWQYETTPQEGLNNRCLHTPRGKMLGGSSSINALIYQHCSPDDFDEWVQEGCEGWGYDTMKQYLKKSENYIPDPEHPHVNIAFHGDSGPWQTRYVPPAPMSEYVLQACETIGIKRLEDLNTPDSSLGASNFLATINSNGTRNSTSTAYLTPSVLARSNLTVAVKATVERIILSRESGKLRAAGIQLSSSRTGPSFHVSATLEIIICGGAIATPHLLLVSGIGPKDELEKVGITSELDLPAVGKNLYDHISCGPMAFPTVPELTWDHVIYKPLYSIRYLLGWLLTGKGPFGSLAAPTAAFVRSDDSKLFGSTDPSTTNYSSGPNAPDLELLFFPFIALPDPNEKPPAGETGITGSAIVLRPEGSGEITVSSSNIWDQPILNPKFLQCESDIQRLIKGIRLLLKLRQADPLSKKLKLTMTTTDPTDMYWPANTPPDQVTDEELLTLLRKKASPAWHPTSSARMGTSPRTSVVDSQLRVHGVTGLRVVDASIFPKIPSGHPVAIVVAVAERAADLIRSERK